MNSCPGRFEIAVGNDESDKFSGNNTIIIDARERCDITVAFPEHIGSGDLRQIYLDNGLKVTIINSLFHETVMLKESFRRSDIRVSIVLSGSCSMMDGTQLETETCVMSCNHLSSQQYLFSPFVRNMHVLISSSPECFCKLNHDPWIRKSLSMDNIRQKKESFPYQFKTALSPMTPMLIDQINSMFQKGSGEREFVKEKIMQVLMLQTALLYHKPGLTQVYGVLRGDDIKKILLARDILVKNLVEPPSLVELAAEAGINEYKLKKGFKEVFGTTVYEYLRAKRMERAHELLRQGNMKVIEISYMSGYSNPSNFAFHFKRTYGVNPGKYLSTVRKNVSDEINNNC